jgi:uncharacterized membrane protein YoaK (UPF0700 family)
VAQVRDTRYRSTKIMVALSLTFAAGCVDIVGYLAIYKLFTAHMTGVTVHLAQNLMARHWSEAAAAACVLGSFMAGSIAGRVIIEIGMRSHVRRIATATLIAEAALIATAMAVGGASTQLKPVLMLLAMLAAAMGLQTATLTRIGSLTVHTTFVTGMLNKLAQVLSQAAFLGYDVRRGRDAAAAQRSVLRDARFFLSIWVLYLTGAVTGDWMQRRWGLRSLLLPIGMVAAGIAVDQAVALSIEEEQDELER